MWDNKMWSKLRKAWSNFEYHTALGCAQRRAPYNDEACRTAWDNYCAVYASYDIPAPPNPWGLD